MGGPDPVLESALVLAFALALALALFMALLLLLLLLLPQNEKREEVGDGEGISSLGLGLELIRPRGRGWKAAAVSDEGAKEKVWLAWRRCFQLSRPPSASEPGMSGRREKRGGVVAASWLWRRR